MGRGGGAPPPPAPAWVFTGGCPFLANRPDAPTDAATLATLKQALLDALP